MATLSIDVPQQLKEQLEAVAAKHAVASHVYILATLVMAVLAELPQEKPFWATATPQERAEDFVIWANSHTQGVGLPDEALRRENMYEER